MLYNGLLISTEAKDIITLNKKEVKGLGKLKGYPFDNRYIAHPSGNVYKVKYTRGNVIYAYPMKPFKTYDGYIEYVLTTTEGTKKHIQGQRIIAGLFIPKVRGKDYVNHINHNRTDNRAENLEWVTHSENIKYSWQFGTRRKSK